MTWQQPSALWLLLAILLLLLSRRVTPLRRSAVANLYLWSDSESPQTMTLSRRVRRHWLLILQAAFVAAVAFALAKPVIHLPNRRIAIVLDISMSMGARDGSGTRLESAKARAASLVNDLPRGGRAQVYLAGPSVEKLGEFGEGASLERALQTLRPTDGTADLPAAIAHVRAEDAGVTRIHVLSDVSPREYSPDVAWVTVGQPAANVALTTLDARSADDGSVELLVAGWNFGAVTVKADLVVSHASSAIARSSLDLPAKRGSSRVMTLPNVAGALGAQLVAADAIAADNVRFTVVPAAERLRAMMIGRSDFVEQALLAHPRIMLVSADQHAGNEGVDPDLVVCGNCSEVPSGRPGAGFLLVRSPASGLREPAPIVVTNSTHPVLQHVAADGLLVAAVEHQSNLDDTAVLARAAGVAVVAAYERGARRIVELGFDPAASPLSADPVFPLLIANAVEWLAQPTRPPMLVAGDALRRVTSDPSGDQSVVTGPDGSVVSHRREGGEIIVTDTARAGVYHLRTAGEDVPFVVNPAAEVESDLGSTPSATVLAGSHTVDAASAGVDVSGGLLIAALVLLALEWRQRIGVRGV